VPHTLLLADDSVTIQRVIELTFADEDVTVVAVSDGDQAIAQLEASPPDIVLADIGMPGRNGYEVAQYIRQTPHLAHIPVVLLTGAFEPVDQARAAEAGCDGVLAKPFEPQLVISRVKELLARPRRAPAAIDAELARPASAGAGHGTPQLADQSLAADGATAAPAPHGELNDYFDRLDAAFATLSPQPASETPVGRPVQTSVPEEVDWFTAQLETAAPSSDHWDLPVSGAADLAADVPLSHSVAPPIEPVADEAFVLEEAQSLHSFEPAPVAAVEHPPRAEPTAPLAAVATATAVARSSPLPAVAKSAALPPLADAFAALLAAEQHDPLPAAAPVWPAAAASAPAITDDLVEDITRRVLDRLTDRVVRETVADVASAIAERMVREEIERIKESIK
jgi:CheY-like chemotaxis protein